MKRAAIICLLICASFLWAADGALNVRIVSDRCPDFYNTKAMAAWATKDCKTHQEKVIAIYDLFRSMAFHQAYPQEIKQHVGTLKLMNVYGWTLCGGQASCLITLYEDAGYKTRYRGWSKPGHTTMEVFYDGKWHFLDSFLKYIPFKEDGTIASQEEIIADPQIALRLKMDKAREVQWYPEQEPKENWALAEWRKAHPMLVCRDGKEGVVTGCKNSKVVGWGGTGTRDKDGYKTDINLRTGMSLKLRWESDEKGWYTATKREPKHSCGTRDIRNCPIIGPKHEAYGQRNWSNGDLVFEPDLKAKNGAAGFDRAGRGLYIVTMKSPFVVSHADIQAEGKGEIKIDIKSRLGEEKGLTPGQLPDKVVRGVYGYTVTIKGAVLSKLRIHSLIQHNRGARPFLVPGANTWKIAAAALARKGRVSIEVAYKPRYHQKKLIDKWKKGEHLYANQNVKEADKPVIVRTELKKKTGIMKFNVVSDKTDDPAYPRMLYIRYSVD
jgi:hypothetical protein